MGLTAADVHSGGDLLDRFVPDFYFGCEADDRLLGEEDFERFVFRNPVQLFAGMNPEFFAGTVVEGAVATLLAR